MNLEKTYTKDAISPKDVEFDRISGTDKALVGKIRRNNLLSNLKAIIPLFLLFFIGVWVFVKAIVTPGADIIATVVSVLAGFFLLAFPGYFLLEYFDIYTGIKKGTVLDTARPSSKSHRYDREYKSYDSIVDVRIDDTGKVLVAFEVPKETYGKLNDDDKVVILKGLFRGVRVFAIEE